MTAEAPPAVSAAEPPPTTGATLFRHGPFSGGVSAPVNGSAAARTNGEHPDASVADSREDGVATGDRVDGHVPGSGGEPAEDGSSPEAPVAVAESRDGVSHDGVSHDGSSVAVGDGTDAYDRSSVAVGDGTDVRDGSPVDVSAAQDLSPVDVSAARDGSSVGGSAARDVPPVDVPAARDGSSVGVEAARDEAPAADGTTSPDRAPVEDEPGDQVETAVAERLGAVVDDAADVDPGQFAAAAVLDVLKEAGWADAAEAAELRAEAERLRELLNMVVRDHRAREAHSNGQQQLVWLVPLLRAAHGVAFGTLGAKVQLRTAVQEVPAEVLAQAGLRIDYGVEPTYEDDTPH